jgi:maltose 6'-phosphate phosphatase
VRRGTLQAMTLNLHTYQEEDQQQKFEQVARAIRDLGVDLVCLQEVGEHWNNGAGDWASNAARIINDQLPAPYHLHADWSHLGFDRYREGSPS